MIEYPSQWVFYILFWIFVLFNLFIFPLIFLFICLSSVNLSRQVKRIWVIAMILTWPIGPYTYALFASEKRLLKGWAAGLICINAGYGLFHLGVFDKELKAVKAAMPGIIAALKQKPFPNLTEGMQAYLPKDLDTLREEIFSVWSSRDKKWEAIHIVQILGAHTDDGDLSLEEFQDWSEKFDNRLKLSKERSSGP